jgi:hypothetical protein
MSPAAMRGHRLTSQVFNFIFFSLLGILYEAFMMVRKESKTKSWGEVFTSLDTIFAKITKAYISQSSYWLSWFPYASIAIISGLDADGQHQGIGYLSAASAAATVGSQDPAVVSLAAENMPRRKLTVRVTAKTPSDLHELGKPVNFEVSA